MAKRAVIALGGNALGNTLPEQMIAVKGTSKIIVDLSWWCCYTGIYVYLFHAA